MRWQPSFFSPAPSLACLACLLLNLKSRQVMPVSIHPLPHHHAHCHSPHTHTTPTARATRAKAADGMGNREGRDGADTRCAVGERLEYFNFIWPTRDRCITRCVSLGPSPLLPRPFLAVVYICHLGISFHLTLLALIFSVGIVALRTSLRLANAIATSGNIFA